MNPKSKGLAANVSALKTQLSANDASAGLLALAAWPELGSGAASELPASFRHWQRLGAHYLTLRCQHSVADGGPSIAPLKATFSASFIAELPPMRGGEYLTGAILQNHWQRLHAWVEQRLIEQGGDFSAFLKHYAPSWHALGRICFHLVENKQDPDYPFAFMATYLSHSSAQKALHKPLKNALQEYAGQKNKAALIALLSPIDLAAKGSERLQALLSSGDLYHPLAWTPAEAYGLLQDIPLLESAGIMVRLPDWWKKRPKARVNVTLSEGNKKGAGLGLNALLDVDVDLMLGDQRLTAEEWRTLRNSAENLVYLKGQWVEVDQPKLDQALAHWQSLEGSGVSFIEGMRLLAGTSADLRHDEAQQALAPWSQVVCDQALSSALSELKSSTQTAPENTLKTVLKAQLRGYQSTGLQWLWHRQQLGLGACLADDMGLGKTLQIIALLLVLKQHGSPRPSLLILPTSLLENWNKEINRFAPSLTSLFLHRSKLSQLELEAALTALEQPATAHSYDLVVTSYGLLSRQKVLHSIDWQLVIADEAQALKNPGTRQSKAAKQLKAQSKIALTGTPIENRLGDLWSLFDFITPGLLGTQTRFNQFVSALERRSEDNYGPLKHLIQPYLLRRLKTDKSIIDDLPEKTETNVYCSLSKPQVALYHQAVKTLAQQLASVDEGIQKRGLVLSALMRFKQICNHPAQALGDGDYLDKNSGKFLRLGTICEAIQAKQEKVLVFTQFRELCDPLADYLEGCFGRSGLVLHGGTSVKQRQQLVDCFQQDDGPSFFVISLKAGGVGLNLTAASHVVHFDRWWNPAVENQATDRAFRIGQKNNVLVHKFVCQGTVEEKIDALLSEKSALADDLLADNNSQQALTAMSDEQLIELVSLNVDRALD